MTTPLFSIIIPTCNRAEPLAQCLDRLQPKVQKNFGCGLYYDQNILSYEVIVADDGQNIRAMLEEKYPWVRYVVGPKKGPAANRNEGAKHAKGAWLVFTDDDCLPKDDWLWEYYKMIQNNKALAYEGRIKPLTPLHGDLWKCPVNMDGGNFWSANIVVAKPLFEQVGGFDKKFPYPAYEDTDLYNRLKVITDIPFVRTAVIYHPVNYFSLWASIQKEMKVIHSRAYLFAKQSIHQNLWKKFTKILQEIKIYGKQLLHNLAHGNIKSATLYTLLLVCGVPTLSYLYFKYNRSLKYETQA